MTTPVVLITGALTGIGRAAAFAFAKQHARVVVSGRSEEAGQSLVTELRALGTEAVAEAGVRVNAVAPGPIDTGMLDRFTGGEAGKSNLRNGVPMKRFGMPDEVARAILYLASNDASFVTGHILSVDGGKGAG